MPTCAVGQGRGASCWAATMAARAEVAAANRDLRDLARPAAPVNTSFSTSERREHGRGVCVGTALFGWVDWYLDGLNKHLWTVSVRLSVGCSSHFVVRNYE